MEKEVLTPELLAYQNEKMEKFTIDNATIQKGGIVFSGDSIIEFFPIKKYLGQDKEIYNRGIAGIDSIWLLNHIEQQVLAVQPSKIFILIGTNDLGMGKSISEVCQNINQMISQIKRSLPKCQTFLLSILPVNSDDDYKQRVKIRTNSSIEAANHILAALPGATYLDLYHTMLDDQKQLAPSFTTDGLHLSQDGYKHVSKFLLSYLS